MKNATRRGEATGGDHLAATIGCRESYADYDSAMSLVSRIVKERSVNFSPAGLQANGEVCSGVQYIIAGD